MRQQVDVFEHKGKELKLIATFDCPFETDNLVDSLSYNGYTCQIIVDGKVVSTILAK